MAHGFRLMVLFVAAWVAGGRLPGDRLGCSKAASTMVFRTDGEALPAPKRPFAKCRSICLKGAFW